MDAALDVPVRTTTMGRDILMQEETLGPQVGVHAPMNCQYGMRTRAVSRFGNREGFMLQSTEVVIGSQR